MLAWARRCWGLPTAAMGFNRGDRRIRVAGDTGRGAPRGVASTPGEALRFFPDRARVAIGVCLVRVC